MNESSDVPDLVPGQTWRLVSGDEVIIASVEGDQVSGSVRPATRLAGLGLLRGTAGIAVFEGHREQFRGAELLSESSGSPDPPT